jgi:hypothetical protein
MMDTQMQETQRFIDGRGKQSSRLVHGSVDAVELSFEPRDPEIPN